MEIFLYLFSGKSAEWCISKIKVPISSPCKLGKIGSVNHSDVTNLSLRAHQDKLAHHRVLQVSGWFCGGNSAETQWAKNLSRRELEWGIGRIRGGLKNPPHRFGGDFETRGPRATTRSPEWNRHCRYADGMQHFSNTLMTRQWLKQFLKYLAYKVKMLKFSKCHK